MTRPRYPKHTGPPPPPLPPVTRTVGQLVAETMKIYGSNPWRSFLVGLSAAVVNVVVTELERGAGLVFVLTAGAVLFTVAFVLAASVVHGVPLRDRRTLTAFAVGVIVFVPFPFFAALYILPGLVWLSFVGLAVPAVMVEGIGVQAALRRGVELARADFVHVLGGLATLTLVVFLTQAAVFFLLREYADNSQRVAATLAYVVITPLIFLGASLLYVDQAARVGTTRAQRDTMRRAG